MAAVGLSSVWAAAATVANLVAPIAWLTWAGGLALLLWLVMTRIRDTRVRKLGSEPTDAIVVIASALLLSETPIPVPAVASHVLLVVLAAAAVWVNLRFLLCGATKTIDGSFALPLATTPLGIAVAAAQQGLPGVAPTATAVAAATWISVLAGLFVQRLRRGPTPAVLVPRLAILVSPPALIWRVWLTMGHAAAVDVVAFVVLSALVAGLLVVHGRTFAASVGTPEGLSLTFPVANASTAIVVWVGMAHVSGWQVIAWAAVAVSSALIVVAVVLHAHHT